MVYPSLEEISAQLDSSDSRDRMLARPASFPSIDAVPLIKKKVLDDEILQIRSMAVFALGIKHTEECYPPW